MMWLRNYFTCHFQCTEIENDDKQDLIEAVTIMADVAAFINESKRRKDIGNYWFHSFLPVAFF